MINVAVILRQEFILHLILITLVKVRLEEKKSHLVSYWLLYKSFDRLHYYRHITDMVDSITLQFHYSIIKT